MYIRVENSNPQSEIIDMFGEKMNGSVFNGTNTY